MSFMFFLFLVGAIAFLVPTAFAVVPMIRESRAKREALPASEASPVEELRQAVASVRVSLSGERAPDVRAKVERLERHMGILRPRLSQLGASTYHTVVSTGTKYLPDAVNAYLRIPRESRDTVVVDGQKTAGQLLCEQLDIMNEELKKILDEAQKVDATDLIVHGRFLEGKYGKAEPVKEDVPPKSDGTYKAQDHRDCEEIEVRSLSGEVTARYCTGAHYEIVVPEARYRAPGELPDVPKISESIPTGTYPVEVVDAGTWESKGGNPGFRLELVVSSGQFAGRKLWKTLVVPRTEQGVRMFERQVAALGARCDLESVRWVGNAGALSMFLGRRANALVRVDDYNGRMFNSVDFLTPDYCECTVDT